MKTHAVINQANIESEKKRLRYLLPRISRIRNFSYESQLNSPVDATVKVKHAALKISQTDLIGTNQGNYERIFFLGEL